VISDVLHDAVTDIDAYLADGSGEAWTGHDWHAHLLELRDTMERLRCRLDGDLGDRSFRERGAEPSDPVAGRRAAG
jgi:hypothetical protein